MGNNETDTKVYVYLAGNMAGLTREDLFAQWQAMRLGILAAWAEAVKPTEASDALVILDPITGATPHPGYLVEADLTHVRQADVVLAAFHCPGVGTASELAASYYENGRSRKAVVWCENAAMAASPWTHAFADSVHMDIVSAARRATEMLVDAWRRKQRL